MKNRKQQYQGKTFMKAALDTNFEKIKCMFQSKVMFFS